MTAHYRLEPGERFGAFEILASLGRGAMAEVYLARDTRADKDVAIKMMRRGLVKGQGLERRFAREARAIAATRHPNIVAIHEVGEQDGVPFIAMEYVEGGTLRDLLDGGPLPLPSLLDIGIQIADGLAAAHEAGIVHRDLKPENVMLTGSGEVRILDFGLSKPLASRRDPSDTAETDEALTLPGTILGTLEYMSPEQASGYRADFRSDQFSLAAILYEMATGVVAFQRDTVPRTLAAVIEGQPTPAEDVGPLREILDRALAKSPEGRFGSMRDMASALRKVRDESTGRSGLQKVLAFGVVATLIAAVVLLF